MDVNHGGTFCKNILCLRCIVHAVAPEATHIFQFLISCDLVGGAHTGSLFFNLRGIRKEYSCTCSMHIPSEQLSIYKSIISMDKYILHLFNNDPYILGCRKILKRHLLNQNRLNLRFAFCKKCFIHVN